MANFSNHPYPSYVSNRPAASVLAALIGISLAAWIIQSIQAHFKPRRLIILLLVSHLTIFTELVLRGALCTKTRNSRAAFTATTILLAVNQRSLILANYDFLTQVADPKSSASQAIVKGTLLGVVVSAILLASAGALSYSTNTIDTSFRLRQASAATVLCLTVLFYPIWFATKTAKDMTKRALVVLIISSFICLIVAVFLLVTSIPDYYVGANQQEYWFYIFQFTPITTALFTWTILHPKRSLVRTPKRQEEDKEEMDTVL